MAVVRRLSFGLSALNAPVAVAASTFNVTHAHAMARTVARSSLLLFIAQVLQSLMSMRAFISPRAVSPQLHKIGRVTRRPVQKWSRRSLTQDRKSVFRFNRSLAIRRLAM